MATQATLVAGICGCDKTTLGKALAGQLAWYYIEAAEYRATNRSSRYISPLLVE
ncbi:MAG: hypothetical protein RLN82_05005 [Pseudomonadales bacterium]